MKFTVYHRYSTEYLKFNELLVGKLLEILAQRAVKESSKDGVRKIQNHFTTTPYVRANVLEGLDLYEG